MTDKRLRVWDRWGPANWEMGKAVVSDKIEVPGIPENRREANSD